MAKAFRDTPWPVLLLVLSFLCPTELSIYVGGARLPPHRALLLLLLPFAVFALFGRKRVQLHAFDGAFLAFAVWTLTAYLYHHGQADGLQTGGALALDSFGSYLVARAFVRNEAALAGTASALFIAVVIAGLFALPEMLFGRIFVHEFLAGVTGYVHPIGIEKRAGLTRAYGLFDHPIHLGTFSAGVLGLLAYTSRTTSGALTRALFLTISALTALSSAPLLGLAAQTAFMGFDRVTRGMKGRVVILVVGILLVFGLLSLVASRSPFALIATGMTFDAWTGYYRLMIWTYGIQNVLANPWMGLGLNDWERPLWMVSSTVDAFWLVIAMRSGLPAIVFLLGGIALIIRRVGVKMRKAERPTRQITSGWVISLLALLLVGCTVHYWNVPFAFFFFFLGLGGCLADPLRRKARAARAARIADQSPKRVRWIAPDAGAIPDGASAIALGPSWFTRPRWPLPVVTASARRVTAVPTLHPAGG